MFSRQTTQDATKSRVHIEKLVLVLVLVLVVVVGSQKTRKLFGALFGLFSRVPESVFQSPRKQPGFQANVSGFFSGWRMAAIGR